MGVMPSAFASITNAFADKASQLIKNADGAVNVDVTLSSTPSQVIYRIGSNEALAFSVNSAGRFKRLEVNTNKLASYRDFNVSKSDSETLVTLKPSYINDLVEGEYELKFAFSDGIATAKVSATYINALNLETLSTGYIAPDGVMNAAATNFVYSEKVPVKEGDTFSIRRIGKFKYNGIIKNTKSNHIIIEILKYL